MSLKKKYFLLDDDEKVNYIFEIEPVYEKEILNFLFQVSKDNKEYDLARIEAIKVLGLMATTCESDIQSHIANLLISLANSDKDDDIRIYSLQSLSLLNNLKYIPESIKDLILNTHEYELIRESAYSVVTSQKDNSDSICILKALCSDDLFKVSAHRDLGVVQF